MRICSLCLWADLAMPPPPPRCVMELFVFVRMGGKKNDIIVKLLDEEADKASDRKADMRARLVKFDASRSRCFLDRDRQRLLAVIEASFGTTRSFDELVLKVFNAQVFGVVEAARANSRRNLTRGVSSKTAGVEAVSVVVKE